MSIDRNSSFLEKFGLGKEGLAQFMGVDIARSDMSDAVIYARGVDGRLSFVELIGRTQTQMRAAEAMKPDTNAEFKVLDDEPLKLGATDQNV